MTRRHRRGRILLALALCAALAGSAAGLALHSRAQSAAATGSAAAPAGAQPSARDRAQLRHLQALLNSGSVRAQGLLAPPLKFAPGSGPVFPAGTKVRIRPRTLRSDGRHGTVQARLSDGATVTLGLYSAQGRWRLYGATAGARTSAAVTGQPARAQLAAAVCSAGSDALAAGTYQGVILVHGFGESASNWDSSGMFDKLCKVPGTRVLKFDYAQVNKKWVSDPAIGPALADYIHQVAKASGRPVIVVGFSMGGLAIRWAANEGARAGDIAMAITIGTPNTGSLLGNAYDILCDTASPEFEVIFGSGSCTQWQAASAMSVFNPEILTLPKLPASIPVLHAIAGEQTIVYKIGFAQVEVPLHGDGVVFTGSALDKRPGSMNDTYKPVASQLVPGDKSAWHLNLTSNLKVQQLVYNYINTYLQANPLRAQPSPGAGDHCLIYQPEDQQATCQPSNVTAYWMTGQGQWHVHGSNLRISPGPPADTIAQTLYGTETWNAGGNSIIGHAQLTFVTQPDGSLAGTYTRDAWYTQTGPTGFQPPSPPEMLAGQTITLVPVAPGLAKTTYNSDSVPPWPASYADGTGNPYWCGAALAVANPSQYCGA